MRCLLAWPCPHAFLPSHLCLAPAPQEGLYLDSHTQRLLAQVVAYNPDLRLFSSAIVAFDFGKGGSVQVGTTSAASCCKCC